eukprot:6182886-Pleurochrysis_carterae.AAC.1
MSACPACMTSPGHSPASSESRCLRKRETLCRKRMRPHVLTNNVFESRQQRMHPAPGLRMEARGVRWLVKLRCRCGKVFATDDGSVLNTDVPQLVEAAI